MALFRFLIVLSAGFLAAAATGKLVPHVPWLVERYGISLGLAGFTVSCVMLPGAVLGSALGLVSDRLGARRVAIIGLAIMAAASLALSWPQAFWQLVLLRLAEGIGYCLLVVAATVLVFEVSAPGRRVLALSAWSSFAPVGFALGQWAASGVEVPDRLAVIGPAHALLLAIAALAIALALPPSRSRPRAIPAARPSLQQLAPALRAALAFASAAGVLLAAVAMAPLVLAAMHGISAAETARLTALAAIPGIIGRFASGLLLGAALTPLSVMLAATIAGTTAIALGLLAPLPLWLGLVLFGSFQVLVGILPGVLSAMIPHVAPAPGELGAASGLINQMVNVGNLIGPPLALSVLAMGGPRTAVAALAAWTALAIVAVAGIAAFRNPVSA